MTLNRYGLHEELYGVLRIYSDLSAHLEGKRQAFCGLHPSLWNLLDFFSQIPPFIFFTSSFFFI
jgi:hypothetical protein